MMKKICGITCCVFLLLWSVACGQLPHENPSSNTNTSVRASINVLPECISTERVNLISMPDRQQYCYQSEDGSARIVLEVQTKNQDTIDADQKKDISIGKVSGISYLYAGGEISYYGVSSNDMNHLLKPEQGERVLEWSAQGVDIRIYGSFSEEELLAAAESVEVAEE